VTPADLSNTTYQGLKDFILAESAAQELERGLLCGMRLHERVDKGWCIDRLRFERMEENRAVFSFPGNDSRFREGDLITLSRDQPGDGVQGTLYRETDDHLWLEFPSNAFPADAFLTNPEGWTIDRAFLNLTPHYLKALDEMMLSQNGQERVLPLLTGQAGDELDAETFQNVHDSLAGSGAWEDQQADAIAACLAAPWQRLVQGPPGTGKTHVLAEVVRRLVENGQRVFLTSLTHRAIDNALAAVIRALDDSSACARIGASMFRAPGELPIHDNFSACPLAGRAGGYVVAATPFVLASRIRGVDFDVIVIDEAGQVTVPLAIMAMVRGRKFLFFGDDQQLGPVIQSLPRRDAKHLGIFQRLQRHDPIRLNVTYRLNDVLAHWPCENFYCGELTPAPSAASRRLGWQSAPDTPEWIAQALDSATPLTWIRVPHYGSFTDSPEEAGAAKELLEALISGGIQHGELAVVVPFRKQARRLRHRLRGDLWRSVVIDTVERMQGQERNITLLSLTTSDLPFLTRIADFYFDPRRLNVAATRARTKLLILASPELLKFTTSDADLTEDAGILQSLLCAAHVVDCLQPACDE